MDFEAAIRAHTDWKLKLSLYLRNPDGSINAQILEQDDHCNLGKWLALNTPNYGHLPLFQELIKAHKEFHKEAAAIVMRKDKVGDISIESAIGPSTQYDLYSTKTISLLMQLQDQVENDNT